MRRSFFASIALSLFAVAAAACGTVVPIGDACTGEACWSCNDLAGSGGLTKTVCSMIDTAAVDGVYDCAVPTSADSPVAIRMGDDSDPNQLANTTSAANACPNASGAFHCSVTASQVTCEVSAASATTATTDDDPSASTNARTKPNSEIGAILGDDSGPGKPVAPVTGPVDPTPMTPTTPMTQPQPSAVQPLVGAHGETCAQEARFWQMQPHWPVSGVTLGLTGYNRTQLLGILAAPEFNDASLSLASELVTTLLNQANGVFDPSIESTVIDAEVWISQNSPSPGHRLPLAVSPTSEQGKLALALAAKLVTFNKTPCP